MDINKHPIWKKVNAYKKPFDLLGIYLSSKYASLFNRATFIGITGSVGKTTTKDAALAVLSQKFKTIATARNIDPIVNIPKTLIKLRPGVKKVILEMGIEYPGEMEFYLSIVRPATAIVTKISYAHSEFLGNLDDIYKEKSLLVKQLPEQGFAILNGDDIYVSRLASETKAQVVFYGGDPKKCHVRASNVRLEDNHTKFELNYGVERVEVSLKLLGRHWIYPALAAAALGITCDLSLTSIKKGLETLEPSDHRLQLMEGLNGWMVLDDTYNSSPAALEEALNALNELPAKRRIAVLGEMRELGEYSEGLHRKIAQKIYKDKVDLLFLSGGDTRYIADELLKLGYPQERMESDLSNSQLVSKIIRSAEKGDLVLVKASRAVRLDEVVKRITKQR